MNRRVHSLHGNRQGGMTLVELMAVVAIMGVMLTIAAVKMTKDPTAEDVSHRLSGLVHEAARKAVSGGSTPNGNPRTRFRIYGLAGNQIAITERYDETTDTWKVITRYRVAHNVDVVGFRIQSELSAGAIPDYALAGGDQVQLNCFPDGTCLPEQSGSTGLTVYLREIKNPDRDARVAVLPLGGQPLVFGSW